mgnify:CR=1 FL=1
MRKLAVYGKGGIGKSTIVSNLSAVYAAGGKKVLQVGCDPKADSTIALCGRDGRKTVLDVLRDRRRISGIEEVLMNGRNGIDCLEAGGPKPGVGCGGRGILRMLEIMEESALLEKGAYDVVLFDVLGDIVCGGFAAPLKMGFGDIVLIVLSEEGMAMYAANNIARMVVEYAENGIALGGLIANIRNNDSDRAPLEEFARRLGTSILGFVPHDKLFKKAAKQCATVADIAPGSEPALLLGEIASTVAGLDPASLPPPSPMENDEMLDFIRNLDDD